MARRSKQAAVNNGANGDDGFLNSDGAMRMILNHVASLSRAGLAASLGDKRRNIDGECGYPADVAQEYYRHLWERDPVGNRVVGFWPQECWQAGLEVYEDEDAGKVTAWERAWQALPDMLGGGDNWHKDEAGSPVIDALATLDEVSRVQTYGVMLLGTNDGKSLDQPLTKATKLTFMRCFPEHLAPVTEWDADPSSARYGFPLTYGVTMRDPRGTGGNVSNALVHWTRVIHVPSDGGTGAGPVNGPPAMEACYNRLMDLYKLYGASAEMYWLGALAGWALVSDPTMKPMTDAAKADSRNTVEQFMNRLQRYMHLRGTEPKSMAPQVVDPTPQIERQLDAICIQQKAPKRLFIGSERGELASSQDQAAHNRRIGGRQNRRCAPHVVAPFVNRLIKVGILPVPPLGFRCAWPDMESMSEEEKASVFAKRTEAMALWASSGLDVWYSGLDYFHREANIPLPEVKEILTRSAQLAADNTEGDVPGGSADLGDGEGGGSASTASGTRKAALETIQDIGAGIGGGE